MCPLVAAVQRRSLTPSIKSKKKHLWNVGHCLRLYTAQYLRR
jgi:hypothetical protein